MASLSETVGARVKNLRLTRCPEESGREFARRAGVNYAQLSRIECGHAVPQLDTLERIAQALALPVADLLRDDTAA